MHVPPFVAHPMLAGGHAQTVVVPWLPAPRMEEGERVAVPIEGGHLAGRLHRARSPLGARGCVLVLHGIAGTSREPFVLRTAHLANERGLDALRLDLRGAGESHAPGPTPLYHAGLTDDVRAAIALLAKRYDRVHAVGFSLGGQIVLRTVAELGAGAPSSLASATAISPPLHLAECAKFSERASAAAYRVYILRTLKARYLAALPTMGAPFHRASARHARTIREYDAAVVAPHFGFRDVDDYYARTSAEPLLSEISVPTLIVHAADDPLVSVEPVVRAQRRRLETVRVVITDRGGHVGFFGGAPAHGDRTRFWAEERAIDLAVAAS
jgi:predicted alpha/beta-fold hydrolase